MRVEVQNEAAKLEGTLTPQDPRSWLAKQVVVVGMELPLEKWKVETEKGLTPNVVEKAATLPSTPNLSQSKGSRKARESRVGGWVQRVVFFGFQRRRKEKGKVKRAPQWFGQWEEYKRSRLILRR